MHLFWSTFFTVQLCFWHSNKLSNLVVNNNYRHVLHIILCEDSDKDAIFLIQYKKDIWWMLSIKQILLNDCYSLQTLILDSRLLFHEMSSQSFYLFCSKVKVNTKFFYLTKHSEDWKVIAWFLWRKYFKESFGFRHFRVVCW